MSLTRPIFVWGMSGVGKSTVGPRLAQRLGVPCADLDAIIEAVAGRSIAQIFADEGETGFRHRESAALAAACADPRPRVIVLGGGALVNTERRGTTRRFGTVISLEADADTLARRLDGADDRPLLDDADDRPVRIAALLDARRAAYADVDHTIATDALDPDQVVDAIIGLVEREAAA